ncbi:MAG: dihydrodipicolinate synthase family protein [Fimbriimonadaceae bacterium]
MINLFGRFAPLPTPYTDDGSTVSEVRLARLVRHLNEIGVDGFVVGSETGEFWVCSMSERKQLTEVAVREAKGKPVIVNVTALASAGALDLAQHAARHGARACVICPPNYAYFSADEVLQHIRLVAHNCEIPLIISGHTEALSVPMSDMVNEHSRCFVGEAVRGGWFEKPTSDEFSVDDLVVSPQFIFKSALSPTFRELAQEVGSARLVKAGVEEIGHDCGPLRSPYRWPSKANLERLKALIV